MYVSCIKYYKDVAYEQSLYYAKKGGLYGKWGWLQALAVDKYFLDIDLYKELVYDDNI